MVGSDERRNLQDDFSFEQIDPRAVILKCGVGLLILVAVTMGTVYGLLPDPLPGEERRAPYASGQTMPTDGVRPERQPGAGVPPASHRSGEPAQAQGQNPPSHAKTPEPVTEEETLLRRATD